MRILTIALSACVIMTMAAFTGSKTLTVTSTAFANNGMIPVKYTCMGQQMSPPLTIGNIPTGTRSLALIVHDPDAPMSGGFTHWVIWNIDASGSIPEDFKNADEGLNSMKQKGYTGICPPKGTHHYHFLVYALDVKLNIDKSTTGKRELENVMKGHILASGDLVGTFDKSYR